MSLVRDPDPLPVSGLVGPETLADPQERLRQLLLAGARENQRRGAARGAAPTGYTPPPVLTLVVKINPKTKHVDGYEGTLMDYADAIDPTRGRAMQAEFNRVLEAEGKKCAHSTPKQVRQILTSYKAASTNIAGLPSARMRWPDMTLRATLEFTEGICLGPRTFLTSVPGCTYARRNGTRVGQAMETVRLQPRSIFLSGTHRVVVR